MKNTLFEKMANILGNAQIKGIDNYWIHTGNDEIYEDFLTLFPQSQLSRVTLDDYAVGDPKNHPNNFCYWLEFKLGRPVPPRQLAVLGSYAIGSARTNFVYKSKDIDPLTGKLKLIWTKQKGIFSDEVAFQQMWDLHQFWLTQDIPRYSDPLEQKNKLWEKILQADQKEDFERWGNFKMPKSRKLRLLVLYQPDRGIAINSHTHIQYFLKMFGIAPTQSEVENFKLLHFLYYEFCDWLQQYKSDIHHPTPFGFGHLLYSESLGINPQDIDSDAIKLEEEDDLKDLENMTSAKNILLYGPPGTGKTYRSIELAVRYADPDWYLDNIENIALNRGILHQKYNELLQLKQIAFVTFHQSYSYEDFVEGIRADTEDGIIKYEIQPGIFKSLVTLANQKNVKMSSEGINSLEGRTIWKMSLGDTLSNETNIYDECIAQNYVLLGYGDSINFLSAKNLADIEMLYKANEKDSEDSTSKTFTYQIINRFKLEMKIGDIVIVSDGNRKFRAIGEISGDYFFLENVDRKNYRQARPVIWHKVFEESLPYNLLLNKYFSQMSLYQLSSATLKEDILIHYLSSTESNTNLHYVLIIDEINRGNISNIFGELITLIELDKRKGGRNALSTTLPYSKEEFSVPNNLTIIGTMNTSDHSLTGIDIALRRRFEFEELLPQPELLLSIYVFDDISVARLLRIMNARIEVLLGKDYLIGHSYFLKLTEIDEGKARDEALSVIFEQQIIPLLQSYFYEDLEKIQWVLNDQSKPKENQFVRILGRNGGILNSNDYTLDTLFPNIPDIDSQLFDRRYEINRSAFKLKRSYELI